MANRRPRLATTHGIEETRAHAYPEEPNATAKEDASPKERSSIAARIVMSRALMREEIGPPVEYSATLLKAAAAGVPHDDDEI